MKITAIRPFPVWVGTRNQLLVKIETDEGIYGWGESGLSGREKAVMGALEHYAQFAVGRDPLKIGALWQEMYRSQYFEGGRVLTAAISAIDIALHDIKGKALGVPVHQLLGGKQRDRVPTFATTRIAPSPELIDQAKALIEAGWTCMRLSVGGHESRDIYEPREHIAATAKWCVKAREELGGDVVFGVDYHHRLSIAEAASFCQKMPTGTLDFLEEPIRDETPEAYENLRKMVDIPFAIGEEFASKWQFLPYLEGGILQFGRIDVCNVGGLTESLKVAALCEAHYIDLMPHNPLGPVCTAASVHLAAAVPNFCWLECRPTPTELYYTGFNDAEIFPMQLKLEGACYAVPDTPGLGVDVDEKRAAREAFKFWEAPHLKRRDGSYTNW